MFKEISISTCSLKLAACSLVIQLAACGLLTAQDLDFPDYRSKKDNFSKIQDKAMRAEVASFALAAVDESIGKAPLKSIPIATYGSNFMTFEGTDNGGENIQ